ncbi:MAG: hypothetical protein KatS3mg035_2179 [Bacteroidia bacterium]|nr:MAG: hypothetical protein KatS3mg035_2179 [Bacteroidia bacterium]
MTLNLKKINKNISIVNIVLFLFPIFLIIALNPNDAYIPTFAAVYYYLLVNLWFILPGVATLLVYKKSINFKNWLNVILMILNIVSINWLFGQAKAYFLWFCFTYL